MSRLYELDRGPQGRVDVTVRIVIEHWAVGIGDLRGDSHLVSARRSLNLLQRLTEDFE